MGAAWCTSSNGVVVPVQLKQDHRQEHVLHKQPTYQRVLQDDTTKHIRLSQRELETHTHIRLNSQSIQIPFVIPDDGLQGFQCLRRAVKEKEKADKDKEKEKETAQTHSATMSSFRYKKATNEPNEPIPNQKDMKQNQDLSIDTDLPQGLLQTLNTANTPSHLALPFRTGSSSLRTSRFTAEWEKSPRNKTNDDKDHQEYDAEFNSIPSTPRLENPSRKNKDKAKEGDEMSANPSLQSLYKASWNAHAQHGSLVSPRSPSPARTLHPRSPSPTPPKTLNHGERFTHGFTPSMVDMG